MGRFWFSRIWFRLAPVPIISRERATLIELFRVAHDDGLLRRRQSVDLPDDLGGGHGRRIRDRVPVVNLPPAV